MSYTVAEAQRAITELYVGIFNRAPDPEGLAYWTGKLVDEGADIDVVRAAFVDSVEWQNGVGQSTNAQVIQHLYESLFEREPEQEGFEFWLNELETGVTTVDQIVAVLIANASAYDQLTLDNKTDAALYYTTQSGGEDMVNDAGFNGAAATQAVDSVDYTTESLEASYAATDRSLEDAGSVFTLTAAEDEIVVGTQYDDIVRGSLGVTLSGFDTIDGEAGDDTLELTVATGDTLGIPGFVDVRNVETVTFDIVDGGLDAELVGGDNFEGLESVNVYSTGGTAESVRLEADVQNINVGMVRDEEGNLTERGVLEPDVYVYVVDNSADDFDTNVAISTDRGAYVESTGDLGDVNAIADGSSLSGDSDDNVVDILAQGDIASVTSTAGADTWIESVEGNIGVVDATASFENIGSSIYVVATPSDPSSEEGNIESVTATAAEGYVYVSALNDIGEVDARAYTGLGVYSEQGDIGSVVTTQRTIDGNDFETGGVDVYADEGAVGSVDVISRDSVYVSGDAGVGSVVAEITGNGSLDVDSDNGGIGSVEHTGGFNVNVDASDNIGSVSADDLAGNAAIVSDYGSIGSVDVVADGSLNVWATEGAIGSVDAEVGSYATVRSSDDIDSVDVTAGHTIVVESTHGNVGEVVGDAGGVGSVVVLANMGTVDSVDAVANIDVVVQGSDGIGSVDAVAGSGVYVNSSHGGVESVTAMGGYYVDVYASDDIGSVSAVAGEDGVYVRSYHGDIDTVVATAIGEDGFFGVSPDVDVNAYGNIGSVTADASDDIYVYAEQGSIDSVDAIAGDYVSVEASDDIGSVDATAGFGGVDVTSHYGDIDEVNAVAVGDEAADIEVYAGQGDIGSVMADASDTVVVTALAGAIESVVAEGEDDITVSALNNVGSVSAVAGDNIRVESVEGDVGTVTAAGETLGVYAAGSVGTVTFDLSDGGSIDANLYGSGANSADVVIFGAESVGDVSVTSTEDDGIQLVVASLGTVGSVSADAGSDGYMYVDVHAENDSSVAVTVTADSDAWVDLFVGSVTSDAAMTSPTELNLTVDALDNPDAELTVYSMTGSNAGAGSDEVTRLETINVDGSADAWFELDNLNETLTTFDGSAGTGNQYVYMTVPGGDGASEQSISITTGTGDDIVDVLYGASDDNGAVAISTGDGDDVVTNDTDIQSVTGSITVDTGAGADSVELFVGSDAVVDVTTGDDNDDVTIYADEMDVLIPRLGTGGDFAAAPGEDGYVDIDLTVDAGSGDDVVEVYANRDSIEAASFAMGDGENTLRYFYHPDYADNSGSVTWSDADTDAFSLGNVTGAVHTLGIDVNLDISGDVTLDINPEVGGVSVLELGGAELDGSDASHGAVLTIDGAAADFTIVTNGSADFGDADTTSGDLDEDILTLVTPGVETLTIDHGDSEIGLFIDGADNASLTSITTVGSDDYVDLALVGFDNGLDVSMTLGDNTAELLVFGGTYGDVSVVTSDEAYISLQSYENDTSDATTPVMETLDVTMGDVSLTSTAIYDEVKFDIDGTVGYTTDGMFVTEDGTGTVSIGDVTLAGGIDTELEIDDFVDSSISIGAVSVTITTSDDIEENGYVDIDDVDSSTLTMGNIDVDATVGSDSFYNGFDVQITYSEESSFTLGDITMDQALAASDTTDVYSNLYEVEVENNRFVDVQIGSITTNLDGGDFELDIIDNTDSTVVVGDVDITAERSEVRIWDNLAETDDLNIVIGDVSMHDSHAGGEDMAISILDNTDDFSAGLVEITLGDVTMTGSDGARIEISGNRGETDDFSVRLVDRLGVQITLGDVDIDIDASGEDLGPMPSNSVSLYATDNEGANITVGDVNVNIAADLSDSLTTQGMFIDAIADGYETLYTRGDTNVTIGANSADSSDAGFGYAFSYIQDNDDSEVDLGDYTVMVGGSDAEAAAGIVTMVVDDNDDALVSVGDVSLSVDAGAGSDAGVAYMLVADNDSSELVFGSVNLDGGSSAVLAISDHDYSTVMMDDVTLGGDGGVRIEYNYDSSIEIGDVTQVGDGSDDLSGYGGGFIGDAYEAGLSITDNNYSTITVGDFTSTATYTDAYVEISENTDSAVEVGDISLSQVDYVGVDINRNFGDYTDTDITVGDITVTDISEGFSLNVESNDYVDLMVGDVTVSDAGGSAYVYIDSNDYSTLEFGDLSVSTTSDGDNHIDVEVSYNDFSTVELGSIALDSGYTAAFDVHRNDSGSIIGSDSSTIDIAAVGSVDFDIRLNDNSAVMFSDVTLTSAEDQVDVYIEGGVGEDGSVSLGDFVITASDDVFFDVEGDVFGNDDDGEVSLGDLSITITGDESDDEVEIDAYGAEGLETITISGGADDVHITMGDKNDTYDSSTQTTLIDMSGMTEANATILIDFVADGNVNGDKDQDFLNEDAFRSGYSSANLSDDMVIKFGEFGTAYVETLVNDDQDNGTVNDFDGVRQTYVFEGSDIGDITIQGFVAGFGAYRDIDLEGGPGDGYEDGRGNGDVYGGPGSNYFDYNTPEADGQAQLRTDRLDFSQFEGVDSLDDLRFEFDDDSDSVIITAADGQFDGRIVVTGQGVDADNGETDESIMDRVADSIIFG